MTYGLLLSIDYPIVFVRPRTSRGAVCSFFSRERMKSPSLMAKIHFPVANRKLELDLTLAKFRCSVILRALRAAVVLLLQSFEAPCPNSNHDGGETSQDQQVEFDG